MARFDNKAFKLAKEELANHYRRLRSPRNNLTVFGAPFLPSNMTA